MPTEYAKPQPIRYGLHLAGPRCGAWIRRAVVLALASAATIAWGFEPSRPGLSAAPHAPSRSLVQIGRAEGLPSTQVHDLAFDDRGFPWFAGPAGLARHEGARIRTFGPSHGLSTQGLRAIAADSRGRLWIGTDTGVDVRASDGTIGPLREDGAWRHGVVEALLVAGEDVWIGTTTGLYRWREGAGLETVAGAIRTHLVTSLVLDSAGRLWVASPTAGLFRRENGQLVAVTSEALRAIAPVRVLAASARSLFVGGDRGLVEIEPSTGNGSPVESLAELPITAVELIGDGLWVGAGSRLVRLERSAEGSWLHVETVARRVVVNRIVRGPAGNVWIGTDGDGVLKVSLLSEAIRRVGLPCSPHVHAVRSARDGSLLVGAETCSVRLDLDDWTVVELHGLEELRTWDLLEDASGQLWAATENGLYRAPAGGGPFVRMAEASELGAAPGRALLEIGPGRILVGTLAGLFELRTDGVTEILDARGRGLGYVYTLETAADGTVWIGTIGNGAWTWPTRASPHRAPYAEVRETSNVYAIAPARDGSVALVQDDQIVVITPSEAHLLPPAVPDAVAGWSALYDDAGRLWIGGNSGLVGYDPDSGRVLRRLVATMGLQGDEFTTSRSLLAGREGVLYCGLDGGLSIVDPERLDRLEQPPRVELAEIRWSNAELESSRGNVVVRPGRWALEVDAASSWFADERSLLFRHRLAGFDRSWGAPTPAARHQIHYAGLPPGAYTVEAQAFSPLTGWGPPAALLAFDVAPYWWQSRPLQFLWPLLVVAAGVGIWSGRARAHRYRSRELERMVEERTAELERSKKALEHLATHDMLTGLANQRLFWERARRFHARATRGTASFALILFDLDRFKRVNDSRGHQAGDELLRRIAERLGDHTREQDLLARYGGEEFAMLVDSRSGEEAVRAAERLRASLSDTPFVVDDGEPIRCTASFGVVQWQEGQDLNTLFRLADAALYQAKRTRDSVVLATNPNDEPSVPPSQEPQIE